MNPNDFRRLIADTDDKDMLGPCFRDDTLPYVFEPRPPAWREFRDELGAQLGTLPEDFRIVGSGRFGFSLKPGNNLKGYTDRSDIDVVIVSATRFDELWYSLLNAAYPRPPVTDRVGGWLKVRQRELYTGWLSPLEVRLDSKIFGERAKGVLEFNARWFNAFKKAARHAQRRHEDVTCRLYRTWQHADLYHLNSLRSLRKALAE